MSSSRWRPQATTHTDQVGVWRYGVRIRRLSGALGVGIALLTSAHEGQCYADYQEGDRLPAKGASPSRKEWVNIATRAATIPTRIKPVQFGF
jgi:hypothetical protein